MNNFKGVFITAVVAGLAFASTSCSSDDEVGAGGKAISASKTTVEKPAKNPAPKSTETVVKESEIMLIPPPNSKKPFVFENCAQVRAAGADPIFPWQPGWGDHLDRDNDGIGCEIIPTSPLTMEDSSPVVEPPRPPVTLPPVTLPPVTVTETPTSDGQAVDDGDDDDPNPTEAGKTETEKTETPVEEAATTTTSEQEG